MGAEHKLDLTSDTTHLIVGSTDTMKYKYVARERQDIKVLRPEWIEAVRESWMNDRLIDLEEVSRQYRMPTLANLKICITGFEDLSFRAQLQKNVLENGGEYTGDLTKDVTHLIAAVPEGKKYEYGTQWQKKTVSLKWYQDTLERGMQLDESRYHPTTPPNEQGVGAWIRKPGNAILASKRPREEPSVPMPSRKLRRTASAKFGSQNQSMWTDIVGGSAFDETSVQPSEVKNAVSMAALTRDASGISGVARVNKASTEGSRPIRNGFLSGHAFSIYGFDEKKVRAPTSAEELNSRRILTHGIASPPSKHPAAEWWRGARRYMAITDGRRCGSTDSSPIRRRQRCEACNQIVYAI